MNIRFDKILINASSDQMMLENNELFWTISWCFFFFPSIPWLNNVSSTDPSPSHPKTDCWPWIDEQNHRAPTKRPKTENTSIKLHLEKHAIMREFIIFSLDRKKKVNRGEKSEIFHHLENPVGELAIENDVEIKTARQKRESKNWKRKKATKCQSTAK